MNVKLNDVHIPATFYSFRKSMSDEIHADEEIYLPNEILAIIINDLASHEYNGRGHCSTRAALASCRLASHFLYSLATPLLFSSIQLTESLAPWVNDHNRLGAFEERMTKLKQILTTSDIAASVHTLELCCRNENLESFISGNLISAILRRLPYIRTFIMDIKGVSLRFSAITEDLASAIKALCRSSSLTAMDLGGIINFPIASITASPNLQCLRLSCVTFWFDHMDIFGGTSNLQPCKLDSLEIDQTTLYYLGDLSPAIAKHFSRIKNLQLKFRFSDDKTLKCGWDIMLLASQSLTTFDFFWEDPMYGKALPATLEVDPFDLGRLPALRHFKIQLRISFEGNATMLCHLKQFLSISSSTSGIETLEIIITWTDVMSGCEEDLFSSDAEWSALDEVLSSEKFVSLQKVVFRLGLEKEGDRAHSYRNKIHLDLVRSSTLPCYVNTLFPTFRTLTVARPTLKLYVETLPI